jgi:hypothetical protein
VFAEPSDESRTLSPGNPVGFWDSFVDYKILRITQQRLLALRSQNHLHAPVKICAAPAPHFLFDVDSIRHCLTSSLAAHIHFRARHSGNEERIKEKLNPDKPVPSFRPLRVEESHLRRFENGQSLFKHRNLQIPFFSGGEGDKVGSESQAHGNRSQDFTR